MSRIRIKGVSNKNRKKAFKLMAKVRIVQHVSQWLVQVDYRNRVKVNVI